MRAIDVQPAKGGERRPTEAGVAGVSGEELEKSEAMEERSALHSHFPPSPHYFSIKLAVLVESQHPHRPRNPRQRCFAQRDALIDVRQTYDKGEGTGAGSMIGNRSQLCGFSALHKQAVFERCETKKGEKRF